MRASPVNLDFIDRRLPVSDDAIGVDCARNLLQSSQKTIDAAIHRAADGTMKLHLARYPIVVILGVLVSACGTAQPVQPTFEPASPTPDLCSSENISNTVRLVNDTMRQFDDYSLLASNIVQSQLVLVIPPMQEIRRDAEDQAVPGCLAELKRLELLYMDSTLEALLAFQSSSNVETLTAAILQSRENHEQYALELARLLGVTLTPPVSIPTAVATP